jgi:hypothetical protein
VYLSFAAIIDSASFQVIKNLALAGVGSIVLVDERTIGQVNQGNFLISSEMDDNRLLSEASACSLREMNPLVKIDHSDKSLTDFLENEQVENFGIVLAFDLSSSDVDKVDSLCSAKSIPFACCICRGVSGWIFSNPQNHEYVVEVSEGIFSNYLYGLRVLIRILIACRSLKRTRMAKSSRT